MDRSESLLQDVHLLLSNFHQIHTLQLAHNSDPYQILEKDQNLKKTAESYNTLLKSRDKDRIYEQLRTLSSKSYSNPFNIFPTSEEIINELIPILEPIRIEMPFYTTNLNLSCPVGVPESTSLNVIIRMYTPAKKNIIKIKIGAFIDHSGELFWEVGFVDVFKSIRNVRQHIQTNFRRKGDYFLLKRLVDCTKTFISRRVKIAGLDLSPAYYHVLQLCRRLGGRTVTEFDWLGWKKNLEEAYQYSIQLEDNPKEFQSINKRYVISWMFDHGFMKDPSGKVMRWEPPRLLWFPK